MKKSLFFAAALIIAASCSNNFTVKGSVANADTLPEDAYVAILSDPETEVATSEIKDGKFSLSIPANPEDVYMVSLQYGDRLPDDTAYQIYVVPEKANATIELNGVTSTIKGSPATDAYNKFQEDIQNEYVSRRQIAMESYMSGDMALADSLESAAEDVLFDLCLKTYEANTNNLAGINALELYLSYNEDLSAEDAEALVAKGGKMITENEEIAKMVDAKRAKAATAEGQPYVEITGKTAEGGAIKLSDFVGKGGYVLIDFWASWCGPCMNAVPNLRGYLEEYKDKGFQLIGINCWERKEGAGQAKAKEMDMTWPVIFTTDDQVEAYGVEAIPTLILFAPDGTIAGRLTGESGLGELLAKCME